MNRMLVAAFALIVAPAVASADNIGGCGWGSKLFHGQKGIAPQVLAVTTNGTSGNQTFGISSGTSGCTQDGAVSSNWKTAAYIDGNMNRLARDISRGEGESLASLAQIVGVKQGDSVHFASVLKSSFSQLFPSSDTTSAEVTEALRNIMASDATLAQYSANV